MVVIPFIMPAINWTGLAEFYRKESLPNPIRELDSKGLKHEDPSSLLVGIDAPGMCYISFLIQAPMNCAFLLSHFGIQIKVLHNQMGELVFLAGACFPVWKYAIMSSKQSDGLFQRIREHLDRTGLKQHLRD